MQEIIHPNPEPVYFVAYNDDELFCRYGKLYTVNRLTTGLDNIQQFAEADVNDWVARVADFGITLVLVDGEYVEEE